jgi:hypothetical protein
MEKLPNDSNTSNAYEDQIINVQLQSQKDILEHKQFNINFYHQCVNEKTNNILIPILLSLEKLKEEISKIKNRGDNLLNNKVKKMIINKSLRDDLGFSIEGVQSEIDHYLLDTKSLEKKLDWMMNLGNKLEDIIINDNETKKRIEEINPERKLSLTNFLKNISNNHQKNYDQSQSGRNNIEPDKTHKNSNLHENNKKFNWEDEEDDDESDEEFININKKEEYCLLENQFTASNFDLTRISNNIISVQRNDPHQFLGKKVDRDQNSQSNIHSNQNNQINPNKSNIPKIKTIFRQNEEEMINKLKEKYSDKFNNKKFTKKFVNTLMKKILYEKKFKIGKEKIFPLGNLNYKFIKLTITAASPHVLKKDSQLITMLRGFFKDYIYSFHFSQNEIIFGGIFSSGMKFASFIEFLNNTEADKMFSITEVNVEVYSYFPDLFVEILHEEQYETNISDVFFGTLMDEFTLFQDMRNDVNEITINKHKSANEKFNK